jgi:hypothetical protein
MIFQSRVTIVILAILLMGESGASGSCGNQRKTPAPAANTNMTSETASAEDTVWGGPHVHLVMTAKGAELEFDCAHGQIKAPIKGDSEGRFDLPGTFVRERGGPIRSDETPAEEAVRYSGRIVGDSMTLTITLVDSHEKLDTFSLARGKEGRLWKCK